MFNTLRRDNGLILNEDFTVSWVFSKFRMLNPLPMLRIIVRSPSKMLNLQSEFSSKRIIINFG